MKPFLWVIKKGYKLITALIALVFGSIVKNLKRLLNAQMTIIPKKRIMSLIISVTDTVNMKMITINIIRTKRRSLFLVNCLTRSYSKLILLM